jgi:hypothetical protein
MPPHSSIPDLSSDPTLQWALVVGFFLPLILSVVQKSYWPSPLKAMVCLCGCAVAACGTLYFQHRLTLENLPASLLSILAATVVFYKLYWHPSGIADSIEKATDGPQSRRKVKDVGSVQSGGPSEE